VLERVESLLAKVQASPDAAMRETARELVRSILEFHRAGLGRMMEVAGDRREAFGKDPAVEPLLLLHGLHPVPLEARVERALGTVRPYLMSHGGSVEVVGIEEGRVRLRLQGSCTGCPSSARTIQGTIEQAILAAAPDVEGIEVA
jgi:Fe-S cluster biogenesis protein NfuA